MATLKIDAARIATLAASAVENADSREERRRRHDRIAGPFEGRRLGLLETAVSLYDLSMGGCFVNSLHDQKEGTPLVLKIDLPYEGWITVRAETVYRRLGFGFAVRFVALDPETEACLERSIRAIQNRQPYDE